MKVLLIRDVYNLGRAGEIKKVANGYGRNFLIPQKLAVMATPGALKQVEKIQLAAEKRRLALNEEMSGVAEKIKGLELSFTAKVGETGHLYGSITQQMIADAIEAKSGVKVDRHWIESQPLREVGLHHVKVRLTFDLIPEVNVTVVSEEEVEKAAKALKEKEKEEKKEQKEKEKEKKLPTIDEIPSFTEPEQKVDQE
ncbi:MAG: 50S ribosomal protein L9 [Pelolinea sp.]|jgi:large subunit ribosomal protein L9|nr:50S ribosomal protein L9 [Pelolinea sp.]